MSISDDNQAAPPPREPIFNIPDVLSAYVAVLVMIHLVRIFLLTPVQDDWLVSVAGFNPARYVHPLSDQSLLAYLLGPVGYSLLHGGWAHLVSNALFLVVFGTPVTARIGAVRFTVLWVTSAIFSAFFLAALTGFGFSYLIGASAVVSAAAGASCRFVMPLVGSRRAAMARFAPRLGIFEALFHRSVLAFIGTWLAFNVVLAGIDTTNNIAWQAHLGGFLFGYLTFGLFDPPFRR